VGDSERGADKISARHMPSLDGIRAISFLLVFFSHAGLGSLVPGGIGVTIFFFLSGFLITTLMRVEFDKNGSVNFRHFWLRRAFRILPPFYLVLLCATLGSLAFDPPGTLYGPAVAAQLLHVTNYWIIWHGYSGQPAGTGVYWSLAVEEHFYVIFPFLYAGMRKLQLSPRGQVKVLWGICALVLLWRCILVFVWHVSSDRTYMGTDTRFDSIMFGCALAVWNNPALDAPLLNERRWKFLLVPAALAVIVGCLLYRAPAFRETVRYTLQGIALTLIFIAAIRFSHWLPFRFLNWRPIAFMGVLSYSLYLMHLAVLFAMERNLPAVPPLLQGLLALCVAVFLSWIMYEVIEKPAARWRRRLTD
jgi:peptidoglycan/LPS O-acetylase OafA/YrhL